MESYLEKGKNAMSADYRQLTEFTRKLERLNNEQKDEFLESCCKELAARLLAKVVHRTPVGTGEYTDKNGVRHTTPGYVGGTLRRGWTAGQNKNATAYANSLEVRKVGDSYIIDIINPVEYASYVEYGHRDRSHTGWVPGKFMLTISEQEIRNSQQAILQKKLNKYIKQLFNE